MSDYWEREERIDDIISAMVKNNLIDKEASKTIKSALSIMTDEELDVYQERVVLQIISRQYH